MENVTRHTGRSTIQDRFCYTTADDEEMKGDPLPKREFHTRTYSDRQIRQAILAQDIELLKDIASIWMTMVTAYASESEDA